MRLDTWLGTTVQHNSVGSTSGISGMHRRRLWRLHEVGDQKDLEQRERTLYTRVDERSSINDSYRSRNVLTKKQYTW